MTEKDLDELCRLAIQAIAIRARASDQKSLDLAVQARTHLTKKIVELGLVKIENESS